MLLNSLGSSTQRRVRLLQRALEVVAVLMLAFLGTLINLIFGWVTLLFRPATAGAAVHAKFAAPMKSSKHYQAES